MNATPTISTHLNGMLEVELEAADEHANPLADVGLIIDLKGPNGETTSVDGFWDGGRRWCFRFSPDALGQWEWRSRLEHGRDAGLSAGRGTVDCSEYQGANPVFAHGPLKVHEDGSHLRYRDGTPFFWLGDTAWNGVIRADDAAWDRYLELRCKQGFTVIQFVATHWRGTALDPQGEASCTEVGACHINPTFFQRIDRRIAQINAKGLIAAPVGIWSLLPVDLARTLATDDVIRVLRYVVARYGAHQVVWLLGGDGQYLLEGAARWRHIGRAVFRHARRRLATLHPCGLSWIGEAFRGESWFDFIGYQSGHGDSDLDLRWHTEGPPLHEWQNSPIKPIINLEPNYEAALGFTYQTRFDVSFVRRAAYWSLLVSPPAGITFGHDAIWNWNAETGPSEGHGNWGGGRVEPWHTGLDTPGVAAMTAVRKILDALPWWTLRPCKELILEQPAARDPHQVVVAAKSEQGQWALVYTPRANALRLHHESFAKARWISPRDTSSYVAELSNSMQPPGPGDWLLLLHDGSLDASSPDAQPLQGDRLM